MKIITTQKFELLRVPLVALQPKPNWLSQFFRTNRKNEALNEIQYYPQGDALYKLFRSLWNKVPTPYADCITGCTMLWKGEGFRVKAKRWKGQTANQQGVDFLHFCGKQVELKISFRWSLQGNEAVLVVFFVASRSILDAFVGEFSAVHHITAPALYPYFDLNHQSS